MKNKGHENLRPVRTTEEAKARGKLGGIKSGEAKRKKKLLSEIYADILAEKTDNPKGKSLKDVVSTIIENGGAPAVSMLKEIREATEGSNVKVNDGSPIEIIITEK